MSKRTTRGGGRLPTQRERVALLGAAVLATFAGGWWVGHGYQEGAAWLVSGVVAAPLVLVLLGWLVDSRERLVRQVAQHAELSHVATARAVDDRRRLEALETEHLERLEAAVRLRTEQLQERNLELEEARREILLRLALAAEYRDEGTFEHVDRVGRAAGLLASELRLPVETVKLIRDAAPLHDLGKIAVSDTILLKPGKLTGEEHATMRRHTLIGSALLAGSASDVLRMAEEIALNHHEWWDGSGYPVGLAGDAIPLSARIVAAVDVFDALTHDRPYRAAWSVEEAVEEIHRLRGRQFDPAVVDAFDRLDPHALADLHPGGKRAVA